MTELVEEAIIVKSTESQAILCFFIKALENQNKFYNLAHC